MEAESFKKVSPTIFYKTFLDESFRPDGRSAYDVRDIAIAPGFINTADGSCLVHIGSTTVLCGIKGEVVKHSGEINEIGNLDVNLILSPLCSTNFKVGKPTKESLAISQYLHKLFTDSILDLCDLVIEEKKYVWTLHADILCLNYDGNIYDSSTYALYGALKNTRLPAVKEDAQGELTYDYENCTRLSLLDSVNAQTFCYFDSYIISDPTAFEEDVVKDSIHIVVGKDDKILSVSKNGSCPLSQDGLRDLLSRVKSRSSSVFPLFDKLAVDV